jgi:hypothetical protein
MQSFKLLLVVAFLAVPRGNAAAQDKMIVATLRSVSQACFWVALESGFYKEYGLEVLPVRRLKTDREFSQKVLAKYLGNPSKAILDETYDFWSGIFPARPLCGTRRGRKLSWNVERQGFD